MTDLNKIENWAAFKLIFSDNNIRCTHMQRIIVRVM